MVEDKDTQAKKRMTTEDKLKVLLDEHYARIEQLIKAELDHVCYRVYGSVKAEFERRLGNGK